MFPIMGELAIFATKLFIIFLFIVAVLLFIAALAARNRMRRDQLSIQHLNEKYDETRDAFSAEVLSKKAFKQYKKSQKARLKALEKSDKAPRNLYVLQFDGDMKASAVTSLREEITAILQVATESDEVVLRLESPGGLVPHYGLAAAQLVRLRNRNIPLTVIIDKVAASGGYLMACTANQILAAPFAIIGSIGVLVQLPNFHRLLKNKDIDFVQLTSGEYKRTISMFGENTKAGEEKMKQELEDVHHAFKQLITTYRPTIDIQKIATGEYWLGEYALSLKLIDGLSTSDEYLLQKSKDFAMYEIRYLPKPSLLDKVTTLKNAILRH